MHDYAALLEHEWRSVESVCADLTGEEWDLNTDCPGWTVKDQVSHLVSYESILAGNPPTDHQIPDGLAHVRDGVGRFNEREVDVRRPRTPEEVLGELNEVMPKRLLQIRQELDSGQPVDHFGFGEEPPDAFFQRRIVDWWGHEQDIRRAAGRVGNLEGEVCEVVRDRFVGALGYILARKVGADDGTVVSVLVRPDTYNVQVSGKRGELVDEEVTPSAKLNMDFETYMLLGMGRRPVEELVRAGRLLLTGDEDLGRTFAKAMNVTP